MSSVPPQRLAGVVPRYDASLTDLGDTSPLLLELPPSNDSRPVLAHECFPLIPNTIQLTTAADLEHTPYDMLAPLYRRLPPNEGVHGPSCVFDPDTLAQVRQFAIHEANSFDLLWHHVLIAALHYYCSVRGLWYERVAPHTSLPPYLIALSQRDDWSLGDPAHLQPGMTVHQVACATTFTSFLMFVFLHYDIHTNDVDRGRDKITRKLCKMHIQTMTTMHFRVLVPSNLVDVLRRTDPTARWTVRKFFPQPKACSERKIETKLNIPTFFTHLFFQPHEPVCRWVTIWQYLLWRLLLYYPGRAFHALIEPHLKRRWGVTSLFPTTAAEKRDCYDPHIPGLNAIRLRFSFCFNQANQAVLYRPTTHLGVHDAHVLNPHWIERPTWQYFASFPFKVEMPLMSPIPTAQCWYWIHRWWNALDASDPEREEKVYAVAIAAGITLEQLHASYTGAPLCETELLPYQHVDPSHDLTRRQQQQLQRLIEQIGKLPLVVRQMQGEALRSLLV